MRKLLTLMLVLAMASVASAGMFISVNGVVDPEETSITLVAPSGEAIIDIHGVDHAPGAFYLGVKAGDPGSLDATNAVIYYQGSSTGVYNESDSSIAGMLNIDMPYVFMNLTDVAVPALQLDGLLVDDIVFHCDDIGDVLITLYDGMTGEELDTQVIHQIPEPMTIALLGLGGLFLRRRK